jgi:hypothetical protein
LWKRIQDAKALYNVAKKRFSLIYSNKIENTQWDNKLFLLLCFLTGWWFHNAKSKGFEYWFGGIDINTTPEEETSSGHFNFEQPKQGAPSGAQQENERTDVAGASGSVVHAHSAVHTRGYAVKRRQWWGGRGAVDTKWVCT